MRYFTLLAFLLSIQISFGQFGVNTQQNVFRSSGDAILRVQPNQVVLSLGVETRGKELSATKNSNHRIVENAIAYSKKAGIADKYIQTDYIRIDPRYKYGNDVEIDYYSVVQSFSIVIEDLNSYDIILTELLRLGINKVNNIEFRTTKMKEYRLEVRKMAISAAKEKALFLSQEVGLKLGPIINISESVSNPVNSFSRSNYANIAQNVAQVNDVSSQDGSLSVGMLSLKASVNLSYQVLE